MRRRGVLGALALGVLCGCYRYVPMETAAAPTVGTHVRARLTAEGARSLAPRIGEGVTALEGRVVRVEGGDPVLAVARTLRADSVESLWDGGEPVAVPRAAVAGFERRRLDARRTVGAAAIGAGALFLLGRLIDSLGGSGGGGGGTGTPPPPA